MIPHQITLYNFLSYGATPQLISFEGYSLICLSGRNGHGKSALLDAMTWALWGQARKTTGTAKPDEGLLRLGARSMMVMFEFYVDARLYRVRRELTMRPGNKPYVTLDISVYDTQAEQFHSLTDKTIRQTQEVINRILGLEYDTYVNSAYLRQGNANEFSQKSPKDRKKILTAILGIDKYDALQTRALERARDYSAQVAVLKELILCDEQELATYDAVVLQEQIVTADVVRCMNEIAVQEKDRAILQESYAQYTAKQREYQLRTESFAQEHAALNAQRRAWGAIVAAYRRDVAVTRGLLSRGQIQEWLSQLRAQEMAARGLQRETLALQQQAMVVEKSIFMREQKLQQELAIAQHELTQKLQAADLACQQARGFEKQLRTQREQLLAEIAIITRQQEDGGREVARLTEEMAAYTLVRNRFEKRKTFYNTYVPRMRWLGGQQQELSHKAAMVGDESPSCPLCEQMLSSKRKQFLQEKLHKEAGIVAHQATRLQRVLESLKTLLIQDHAKVKEGEVLQSALQTACGQQEVNAARHAHLQVRLMSVDEALAKATSEATMLQERLALVVAEKSKFELDARELLVHDSELVQLRQKEKEVGLQRANIAYDEQRHALLEQEIAAAEKQAVEIERLDERRAQLASQRADIDAQRRQIKESARLLVEKEAALCALLPSEAERVRLTMALAEIEKKGAALRQQKEDAVKKQGQVTAQRMRLDEQKKQMVLRAAEVAALEARQYDCVALAQAWSKNGIQALLIEQAIPEIEFEANELLSRLSSNQAHVFIESLRDLKRGGARETLDIKIADVMGVRPYEMFSGGEAFRIDFALRIAISKLLAKRAGAHLQILIIDEGFGSQDEEGLAQLMQALYAVQEDFAKIIVVTHLPTFKENFPVHFIVEKGAAGSIVSVEQRG
ncbi:MAG: repair protein SbcC/Rad50 [Candidatus Dependentiae bacterium]|nr:repair protein SbcC/Rad50 [Candidatus Dependentiae bacterium]